VLNSSFKLASDSQVQDLGASTSHQDTSSDQPRSSNQVQVLQPQHVVRDHPIDSVIDDIRSGVQTRSRLAMFCEHASFVSTIEPKKIEEALRDANWIMAM
jgi:hypothetical protein